MTLNGVSSVYDCTGYRLPTESEWEYAARAGTSTATFNGDLDAATLGCAQPNSVMDPIAWFCGNNAMNPRPGGLLAPNGFGLYDMLGNVWNWVHDRHAGYPPGPVTDPEGPSSGSTHQTRGGGWNFLAEHARAAHRDEEPPRFRHSNNGMRVARTLGP